MAIMAIMAIMDIMAITAITAIMAIRAIPAIMAIMATMVFMAIMVSMAIWAIRAFRADRADQAFRTRVAQSLKLSSPNPSDRLTGVGSRDASASKNHETLIVRYTFIGTLSTVLQTLHQESGSRQRKIPCRLKPSFRRSLDCKRNPRKCLLV